MKCPACGTDIGNASNCPSCGATTEPVQSDTSKNNKDQITKAPPKAFKGCMLALVVVVLIGVAFTIYGLVTSL